MPLKETFYLPSVVLEMEFMGEEARDEEWRLQRARMKNALMKRLVTEGVAFLDKEQASAWKGRDGADTQMELVIDAWVLEGKYGCTKNKDRHARKVRWELTGTEPVTILIVPAD